MELLKKDLINVDKTTRAGKGGKLIYCPDCFYSFRVYHFAWAGLWCLDKDCDFSYQNSPNFSIPKNKWLVKNSINKN